MHRIIKEFQKVVKEKTELRPVDLFRPIFIITIKNDCVGGNKKTDNTRNDKKKNNMTYK